MNHTSSQTPGILAIAREQVLQRGEGLSQEQVLEVLNLPDEQIEKLLALAHEVRVKWCGEEVEIEGIVSLKTGGCPEDCHFCSQSGLFETPVRSVWLDIPLLVEQAKQTAKTGATEFCIVAAVKGPDENLMQQLEVAVEAIRAEVDINVAASVGILTKEQVDRLTAIGVHRYNHNLETSRSNFPKMWSLPTVGKSATRPSRWSRNPGWKCAAAGFSAWGRPGNSARSSLRNWHPSNPTRSR